MSLSKFPTRTPPVKLKILEFGGAGINKLCFFDRQLKKGTKMIITLSPNPQANIVNTYLVYKNGSLDNGYEAIEENILDLTTEKMIEYITKSDGFLMVNGNTTSGNKLSIKYQIGIQDKIENNTSDLTINNYYQEPIENKTLSFTGAGQNNFLFFSLSFHINCQRTAFSSPNCLPIPTAPIFPVYHPSASAIAMTFSPVFNTFVTS